MKHNLSAHARSVLVFLGILFQLVLLFFVEKYFRMKFIYYGILITHAHWKLHRAKVARMVK